MWLEENGKRKISYFLINFFLPFTTNNPLGTCTLCEFFFFGEDKHQLDVCVRKGANEHTYKKNFFPTSSFHPFRSDADAAYRHKYGTRRSREKSFSFSMSFWRRKKPLENDFFLHILSCANNISHSYTHKVRDDEKNERKKNLISHCNFLSFF